MTAFISDADAWAEAQFSKSALPDRRLTRRLQTYAAEQAKHPGESTNAVCDGNPAAREGAYRLLENDRVSAEGVLRGPISRTFEVCEARRVLAVQDTTTVAFGSKLLSEEVKKAGSVSGFMVHSALAVDAESGEVLGLLDQDRWIRDPSRDKKQRESNKRKESAKWLESSKRIESHMKNADVANPQFIHVCDREADILSYMTYLRENNAAFIIRLNHNRETTEGNRLRKLATEGTVVGEREIVVAQRGGVQPKGIDKGRISRPQKMIKCEVRTASVEVKGNAEIETPLLVNMVCVRPLEDGSAGGDTDDWLLLTTEPVRTTEEAFFVIASYEKRWRIEEFHKCWKTGCRMEERLFQTPESFERMMVITATIATRIMQLHALKESSADAQASAVLDEVEIACLKNGAPPQLKLNDGVTPTAEWAYKAIAALGGFVDSKRTGRAGWMTLWKGWARLQERVVGWRSAVQATNGAKRLYGEM